MQNNKTIFAAVGGILLLTVVAVGAYALSQNQGSAASTSSSSSATSVATTTVSSESAVTPTQTSSAASSTAGITMAEVAKHSTKTDCWLVVSGKVYNVTSYVSLHPGGTAILNGCGKDATAMFANVGHSSTARNMLNSFYVADVAK